jgi:hypothetical protein
MGRSYLLLTATVQPPPGVPALARTDPIQRMRDYVQAVAFYAALAGPVFDKIIFAENSGYDLEPLHEAVHACGKSGAFEFLSFFGLDHPPEHGRGYGEMKLVDFAMEKSRSLSTLCDGDVVWKCTGRYMLRNAAVLVKTRPAVDLYVHCRNYPYRLCELFAFAFNTHAYEAVLRGVYRHLRNDIQPGVHSNEEVSFRTCIDAAPPTVTIQRRFLHTPLIHGIRGWNNSLYSSTKHPKIMLRQIANKIAPSLWI